MASEELGTTPSMRSLERALDVLQVLSQGRQPIRLTDVSRAAGLHVATTQRILKVLERRSYIEHEKGGYIAGPAFLLGAHGYLVSKGLIQAALPVLQELADALAMTSSLSVRVGEVRVMVARVEGSRPLRYQLPVGEQLPLHVGAGKVFAAWMEEDELSQLFGRVLPIRRSDGTEVDERRFRDELDAIRVSGYATSRNERALGAASVCAPVFHNGSLVAALQVAGRSDYVTETMISDIAAEVRRAAGSISHRLP